MRSNTVSGSYVVMIVALWAVPALAVAPPRQYPGVLPGSREVVGERSATTKLFVEPDGTRRRIITGMPMHFQAGDGWQDIDPTIRWSDRAAADYEMTRSIYKAFFRERFDAGEIVRLHKDQAAVSIRPGALYWINAQQHRQAIAVPQPALGSATGQVITYPGAYGPGMDFQYETRDYRMSKRLVLDAFSRLPAPELRILAGEAPALALDLTLSLDGDAETFVGNERLVPGQRMTLAGRRLEFRRQGERLWFFAPPVGWDDSGKRVAGEGTVYTDDQGIHVTIQFPLAWLRSTTGQITLDPDTYYGESTDGYIEGSSNSYTNARKTADSHLTSDDKLSVGQKDGYEIRRAFLEFDTSAISGSVSQANLYMKVESNESDDDFTVRIHQYDWASPISSSNREANYDGALSSTYDADWRGTSGISTGTYYGSQNLSTSYVNTSGTTRYILISNEDVNDSRPDNPERLLIWANDSGGSTRPYLSITETACSMTLANHDAGQESDAFSDAGSETNAELFGFKLTGSSITVTNLVFTLSGVSGLVDGDWTNVEIVVDDDDDGVADAGETTTVGGSGTVDVSGGTITFADDFVVSSGTNYILVADFASLASGDEVTIALTSGNVSTAGCTTGSTTSVTHRETACPTYVEVMQSWTAGSADSWETVDLSGAPYNVPANVVVEVAVHNDSTGNERWGGIRAVGSALDRRLQLREAEGGGRTVVVMSAQADASSNIQYYSDQTSQIEFTLLGYWECGTYVERFDSFSAGASGSWQDVNLSGYGVSAGQVVEMAATNGNTSSAREVGVRADGSSLERKINLEKAEAGGVEPATFSVAADATANAAVEVYAQSDSDVGFVVLGYWSTAPGAFIEAYSDAGSPSSDTTWEDADLSGAPNNVPANAIVAIQATNQDTGEQTEIGVRADGSSLNRYLDIHEAESGGGTTARMHADAGSSSTVELYFEDVSCPHEFRLTGYWIAAPNVPSNLGPSELASGTSGIDTTPTLEFTQSHTSGSATVAYRIQIDDSSDFSSLIVDYTSASIAQGATSFTVGQAAGSGSYAVGSAGQTLSRSKYYWRVRSGDGSRDSAWSTANSGAVGFYIGLPTAGTCP